LKEEEMPILALFRWHGDAEALVAAYDREMEDAPSVTLDQPGRTLHVFAPGEDGAVVVDLWESEDDFQRMVDDPEFKQNVEASDWPGEPEVEIFQVHATMGSVG
jgi:heme-degrading monooxygenase HmoA